MKIDDNTIQDSKNRVFNDSYNQINTILITPRVPASAFRVGLRFPFARDSAKLEYSALMDNSSCSVLIFK